MKANLTPFSNRTQNEPILGRYPLSSPQYEDADKKKKTKKIKNKRKVMAKKLIEESLRDHAGRGKRIPSRLGSHKEIEASDTWTDDEEEVDNEVVDDVDATDMIDTDEIEINDNAFDDELLKILVNELKTPEFNRRIVNFKVKGGAAILGVPMAKLGEEAFLFKLQDGTLKKFFLRDISIQNDFSRAKTVEDVEDDEDDEDAEDQRPWYERGSYQQPENDEY